MVQERKSAARVGQHPRQPRRKAQDSATAHEQAQDLDGKDIGAEAEAELGKATGSSSSSKKAEASEDQGDDIYPPKEQHLQPAVEGEVPPLSETQYGKERASSSRKRKSVADAAEGTERRSDWMRFDVGTVLRTLKRAMDKVTIERELRKLHLRWWHAPKSAMLRVLEAAGLPKEVTELIPDIIDTCKECRAWQRPDKKTVASFRMSTKFNEHVEMDLMFYKEFIVCHFIDRALRWHATMEVKTKSTEELFEALMTTWISTHGPMQELIVDGESGVTRSADMERELKARGIKLTVRAVSQRAHYIERRGAVLRQTLHAMDDQLKRENVRVSFAVLLSEATFAGNCLTHVGGVTPYHVV